jgi:hypothetical protein
MHGLGGGRRPARKRPSSDPTFLDHFHTCPAVLGDLIDVGTFEQAKANVRVAQAIGRSRPAVAVSAKLFFIKNCVE